jgi:long-chain acyl-CoA synthetase
LPKFRPGDVLTALVDERASVFHGVPTMFTMMLEYVEQNRLSFDLSSVRQMISAGAHLPDEIMDRFENTFHKKLNNYYAMTECTPVFGLYASDPQPVPRGAVGKLAPGTHARILDMDDLECSEGEEGELYVKGAATLKCYSKDPKMTAESLRDGWFKSGDLARFDANGYFYLTGRIKDIIIRGGSKIAPAEVERVLSTHNAVQSVAVIGVPDRVFGEVPAAFVVVRPGSGVTAAQLILHAQAVLADFKVPRQYQFVDTLPMGITGKVDKKALKIQWSDVG